MNSVIPVLLAGGSGTRLWPLSRSSYPKQFSKIIDENSLFQNTALRLTTSKKLKFESHITITNSDFRFIVSQQLQGVGINPGPILIEPTSKNTAAAILSATIYSHNKNNDAIILAASSDHVIPDTNEFHDAVNVGLKEIRSGKIVIFGIKPSHPETGYGYLELESIIPNKNLKLINFIEKPTRIKAKKMFEAGNFLWNAGIFLFRAKDMIAAFKEHDPDLLLIIKKSLALALPDLGFLRLDKKSWNIAKDISIDYAIMEKVKNLSVVPFFSKWSDLGDWNSVWKEMRPDKNGVSLSLNSYALKCSNSLLRTESEQQIIFGIGLKNIIAVAMPDAVLVVHKEMAQDVKKITALLKNKNVAQANQFPKDHRPWGWFESLTLSNNFQVKKIVVNSGAALSLQSHKHRSEHWVLVEGKAKVTINDNVEFLKVGQSVYIHKGATHRLENPSKKAIVLIEVQIGKYFGEDDIIRYEDIYSRSSKN